MSSSVSVEPKFGGHRIASVCVLLWLIAALSTGPLGLWVALGGAAVALGLAVLIFDRSTPIALLRPTSRLVLLGATVGGLMAAMTYLLYPFVARAFPFVATDLARLYSAFRATGPFVAAVALVPIIVGEELVWRGVVQSSLVRSVGRWGGVALAAAAYALVHAPLGSVVLMAAALLGGFVWGTLRARSASLVPAVVAHLLWNLLVLLWLPLDSG